MRKLRMLILVGAVVCCAVFAALALASRTEWAGNGYHLESGQNGFLNHKINFFLSEGKGENRAVCAGIRGVEESCVPRGSYAVYDLPFYIEGEPYLHNHDPEGGYFHGWYE
jgi:hypothetical protein